jgi:hypothetical protein
MNTLKHLLWLSILLLAIILMNACKKSQSSQPLRVNVRLDADGMQFIQAPVGSYFIYLDSATGGIDSVVVTQSEMQQQFHEKQDGPGLFDNIPQSTSEKYFLTMTRMGPGQTEEWLKGETVDLCPCYVSFDNGDVILNKSNGDPLFYYSSLAPNLFTMTVNDIDYNNVKLSWDSVDTRREIVYAAKGVGIIKRISGTGVNTKSWSLLRRS